MKVIQTENGLIKAWVDGVEFEEQAEQQVRNITTLPFVHKHIALMPDVHAGKGSTVGSVVATKHAIVPAMVGVDLGCGVHAVKLPIKLSDLPDNLHAVRSEIERVVPHGRTSNGGKGDRGAWGNVPDNIAKDYKALCDLDTYKRVISKHPKIDHWRGANQLGTLGTGNHFIEVCGDENQDVWVMIHSGSRGPGNAIGSYFIEKAKEDMKRWFINLPDKDLAYIPEGADYYQDYVDAVEWAQNYAAINRNLMMCNAINAVVQFCPKMSIPPNSRNLGLGYPMDMAVNCHHNYVQMENHFGENVWVTRKGAVRARAGEMGVIPGSMGAKSYIVRGLGNPESFNSCSHGAGRKMSRTEAKKRFSLDDHAKAMVGVEARMDADVIDETPMAYKDIDLVMSAQKDLVEVVHVLKQVLCVKG